MNDSKDCRYHWVLGDQKVVSATAGGPWNLRCSINLCKCNEFALQDQASGEVCKPCLANYHLWRLQCSRPTISTDLMLLSGSSDGGWINRDLPLEWCLPSSFQKMAQAAWWSDGPPDFFPFDSLQPHKAVAETEIVVWVGTEKIRWAYLSLKTILLIKFWKTDGN